MLIILVPSTTLASILASVFAQSARGMMDSSLPLQWRQSLQLGYSGRKLSRSRTLPPKMTCLCTVKYPAQTLPRSPDWTELCCKHYCTSIVAVQGFGWSVCACVSVCMCNGLFWMPLSVCVLCGQALCQGYIISAILSDSRWVAQ